MLCPCVSYDDPFIFLLHIGASGATETIESCLRNKETLSYPIVCHENESTMAGMCVSACTCVRVRVVLTLPPQHHVQLNAVYKNVKNTREAALDSSAIRLFSERTAKRV